MIVESAVTSGFPVRTRNPSVYRSAEGKGCRTLGDPSSNHVWSQDGNASCPGIFTARRQRGSFECRIHLKCRFLRQLRSVLSLSAFPRPTEAAESIRRQRSECPVPGCAVPWLVAPLSFR